MGATIDFAAQTRPTFALWLCLMIFTEGGHFVIVPNALRAIYGEAASGVYGVIFTFTGLSSFMIMFVVTSDFGRDYAKVFTLSACLSGLALILLIFCFNDRELVKENKLAKNERVQA